LRLSGGFIPRCGKVTPSGSSLKVVGDFYAALVAGLASKSGSGMSQSFMPLDDVVLLLALGCFSSCLLSIDDAL
jgi:hypothetical protein